MPPRPFSTSQATVTWEDGSTVEKVPVVVKPGLMMVTVNGVVLERNVLTYTVNGRNVVVDTPQGTVRVRRAGGCSCRG